MCDHCRSTVDGVSRRTLLASSAGLVTAGLAGCLGGGGGGSGDVPEPVTLTTDDACEVCGMIIPNHPGPTTEIFYRDHEPSGHVNPARFDSTWEAYQYNFEREARDWTVAAFYVTDYSAVDYEIWSEGADTLISTHVEASAFTEASNVTYVVGSDVKGAMGRDLIGFSDEADATALKDEYGGTLATHDEVTPEMVGTLGN